MYKRPKSVTEFFAHLEKGEEAIAILEEIWYSNDSYTRKFDITDETHRKIVRFFGFDDSE